MVYVKIKQRVSASPEAIHNPVVLHCRAESSSSWSLHEDVAASSPQLSLVPACLLHHLQQMLLTFPKAS